MTDLQCYETMCEVYNTLARHCNERDPDTRIENGDLSQASLSEYSFSQRSVVDIAPLSEVLAYIDSMLPAQSICKASGIKQCSEKVCVQNTDLFSCEPDLLMQLLGEALSANAKQFQDSKMQLDTTNTAKRGREGGDDDSRDAVIQKQTTEDIAWHKSFITQAISSSIVH